MNMITSENPPNICVAGCGHWGQNLIRNSHKLGHLVGICDSDPGRLECFRSQNRVNASGALQEALLDPQVHAAVLATPAQQHAAMTVAALNAGKDVFVEKPLALKWQGGTEIIQTARRRDRVPMAGHLLLYHSAILKIKELLDSEELGRLEYIYSNRLSMGKIRRQENALSRWNSARRRKLYKTRFKSMAGMP